MSEADTAEIQRLSRDIQELKQMLIGKVVPLMTKDDICEYLRIAPTTFDRRITGLVRYGAWKDGKEWRMKRADFENYVNHLK